MRGNQPPPPSVGSPLKIISAACVFRRGSGADFQPRVHLTRVGDILMAVGVLGRLWFYVRGLNPSRFLSEADDPSPLKLNDSQMAFTAYDQRLRTPVERLISYK